MPAPAPPATVAAPPVAITVAKAVTADAATVFPPTSAPLHVLDDAILKLFAPNHVWLQWARVRDSHQSAHHACGGTQSEEFLLHREASHQWNYVGERERFVVVPPAAQLRVAASIISPLIKSVIRKERSGSHRVVGADHTRLGRATSLAHAARRCLHRSSCRPFSRCDVPSLSGSAVAIPRFSLSSSYERRACPLVADTCRRGGVARRRARRS